MSRTEGVFYKNHTRKTALAVKLFVRADSWFYYDSATKIRKAPEPFKNKDQELSLVAPLILGRFVDD